MIILAVDTETTGLKPEKGDRIIEVCLGLYEVDDTGVVTEIETVTQRINPLRAIPIEAQRVHGISLEDLRTMPTWSDFAEQAEKIISRADLVVIHNAEFDAPFIETEQRNAGRPLATPLRTFCTMENARWATFDGKRPTLAELCWSLGIAFDTSAAHSADYDTKKMMECFGKGLRLGLYKLEKGENDEEV